MQLDLADLCEYAGVPLPDEVAGRKRGGDPAKAPINDVPEISPAVDDEEARLFTIKHNPGSLWRARYLPTDQYSLAPKLPTHPLTLPPPPHLWNIRPW